jgi:hypothetical protein
MFRPVEVIIRHRCLKGWNSKSFYTAMSDDDPHRAKYVALYKKHILLLQGRYLY